MPEQVPFCSESLEGPLNDPGKPVEFALALLLQQKQGLRVANEDFGSAQPELTVCQLDRLANVGTALAGLPTPTGPSLCGKWKKNFKNI